MIQLDTTNDRDISAMHLTKIDGALTEIETSIQALHEMNTNSPLTVTLNYMSIYALKRHCVSVRHEYDTMKKTFETIH